MGRTLAGIVLGAVLALLAGQTRDTHLPQNMPTINYSVGWWVGNLGFRRPQLRLTKVFPLGAAREVQVEVGAARTITGRDTWFKLMDRAKVGAELSWWEARYRGLRRGDSLRVQGAFVFEF